MKASNTNTQAPVKKETYLSLDTEFHANKDKVKNY